MLLVRNQREIIAIKVKCERENRVRCKGFTGEHDFITANIFCFSHSCPLISVYHICSEKIASFLSWQTWLPFDKRLSKVCVAKGTKMRNPSVIAKSWEIGQSNHKISISAIGGTIIAINLAPTLCVCVCVCDGGRERERNMFEFFLYIIKIQQTDLL